METVYASAVEPGSIIMIGSVPFMVQMNESMTGEMRFIQLAAGGESYASAAVVFEDQRRIQVIPKDKVPKFGGST